MYKYSDVLYNLTDNNTMRWLLSSDGERHDSDCTLLLHVMVTY